MRKCLALSRDIDPPQHLDPESGIEQLFVLRRRRRLLAALGPAPEFFLLECQALGDYAAGVRAGGTRSHASEGGPCSS